MSRRSIIELAERCKGEVSVTFNEHRSYYESLEKNLRDWCEVHEDAIEDSVLEEMVKRDTSVRLQFYPSSPVGSYTVWHFDLDAAIDEAHAILDGQPQPAAEVKK